MRTSQECASKALELETRAAEAPPGPFRDGFSEMAGEWKRLSVAALQEEAIATKVV